MNQFLQGGLGGGSKTITVQLNAEIDLSLQGTFGVDVEAIKADLGGNAGLKFAVTGSISRTFNLPPNTTQLAVFGYLANVYSVSMTWSPSGCVDNSIFGQVLRALIDATGGSGSVSVPITGPDWSLSSVSTKAFVGPLPPAPPGVLNPPTAPAPQPVTSVVGLADGTLLATTDTHRIYKMVGGAPVWQSTCAGSICAGTPRPTTQAVINAGPATPKDGATLVDEQGDIYKFVGGAPIHLSECAVGCGTPVLVSTWSVAALEHMRPYPADGSTLVDEQGDIYKFVGGAPIRLASCAVGCGSPVSITTWSVSALEHMQPYPVDGSTLKDEQGQIFKFVGGAPIHLATCAAGCGTPVPITTWSVSTLEHMQPYPVDGSTLKDEQGQIFKFVGGAPIHLATCAAGCGTPVPITTWSVSNIDHMRPYPLDGSTLKDEQGQIFKFAGGAPIHLASCVVGCGEQVPVTTWSVANLDHMLPFPADGTTIRDEVGDTFKFVHGAPIHLTSCSVSCGAPVAISGASIADLDHMLATPADGATAETESGAVYKFGGGSPLPLPNCASGCGTPVSINQSDIDNRDHMNAAPAAGTFLEAVETGGLFESHGGQAVPVGQCPAASACPDAVGVNAASIALATGAIQSAVQSNTGFLFLNGPVSFGTDTGLGVMEGTSPATAALAGGGYEGAFQANTGHLFALNSSTGATDTQLAMMPDTSPAIAPLPGGGFVVAFQANTGHLFVWNSSTAASDTQLAMMPGTSPSIASAPDGGFEIAFQANTGNLFTWNATIGPSNLGLGMLAGTNPAITGLATDSYEIAFQANSGNLFTWDASNGGLDRKLGMLPGTSPSIASALDGGFEIAFQANTGHLLTWNSATGTADTNLGMLAGTSPAITTAPGSLGYVEAFQANTGKLFTVDPVNGALTSGLGMQAGTSPAVANSLSWSRQ
ncbi:hypothetical protein GCM10023322_68510 [Rugosimonospora acidiphila]|uniref:Bulb-type lectin domain-containing protein n=1 Tax=Rugosimonospora acidiphila TaxID=556531 RepID=A0ABP9SJ63_9ACTN